MRTIEYLVVHCTATEQTTKVESILNYWKKRLGWKSAGYHFIIEADGNIQQLQSIDKPSNGVKGYNRNAIHVSYIGGRDEDDRTDQQKIAMSALFKGLVAMFPDAEILGHRDFPRVTKSCPRFDAVEWGLKI